VTAEQRRRVEEWFARILELTPPEREEVLAGLEGEDPEVRAGLQRLLSAERKAGSFLETITWFEQERAADAGTGAPAFSNGEQVAGRYRIVRFIQAGGMGEVYEAEDTALRQHVALKTILPEIAGRSRSLERFRREIAMARRVTHPNVCRVFDVGQHTDPSNGSVVTFLTMELLQGETLGQKLKRDGPMGPEEALPLIEQMAEALAAAHEAEVIHRDFKPGNVMLVPRKSGGVKAVVTDFGLAKSTSDEEGEPSLTERGHLCMEVVRAGGVRCDQRRREGSGGFVRQHRMSDGNADVRKHSEGRRLLRLPDKSPIFLSALREPCCSKIISMKC
jgi:eukaryotic-like serine/threonine-protein kinase